MNTDDKKQALHLGLFIVKSGRRVAVDIRIAKNCLSRHCSSLLLFFKDGFASSRLLHDTRASE